MSTVTKASVLALLAAVTAALADSKNSSKGTLPEGAEDLIAQSEQLQADLKADEALELGGEALTQESVAAYLANLNDGDLDELVAPYAEVNDGERPLGPDEVASYLHGLPEHERRAVLEPFQGTPGQTFAEVQATVEDRRPAEPVFFAIGAATFTRREDADTYVQRHGLSATPRALVYADEIYHQGEAIAKPDEEENILE